MTVRAWGLATNDGAVATALGAAAFALYVACLPRTFAFWDTGELQTVAAILGIAHPPACPAFVLLGWLAVHVLPFAEPAFAVNLMCSLAVAVPVALLYATLRRFSVPPVVAALCTLGFAVASVPWHDATRAEVQDLALCFRVAALVFALRWAQEGRQRDLFAAGLAAGFALSTHGIAVLLVPALAPLFAAQRRLWRAPALATLAAGVALGLLPYAYLPLRSAAVVAAGLDPTVALGLPPGLPFWNYDDPRTWHNFLRVVTGADFDVHSGFAGFLDLASYPRFAAALVKELVAAYGFVGCALAVAGAVLLVARRRAAGAALVVAALLPVPYTESYNELQDPSRYYLLTLWCSAVAIGLGFELVADLLQLVPRSVGRFAAAAALVASFVAAPRDSGALFAQRNDDGAPRYVGDVIATTPSNAIVVAEWAYSTPLAYAAYVQGRFGNRIVVAAAPKQYAAFYRRWLRRRPVYIVAFSDALSVPGFTLVPLATGYFHEYKLASATTAAAR